MQTKSLFTFLAISIAATFAVEPAQLEFSKAIPVQEIPGFWNNRIIQPFPQIQRFNHKFSRNNERIVGGHEANPNAHPYQACILLVIHWWTGLCGAVLISDRVLLTAAHCLEDASSAQAILGAHNVHTANEPTQYRRTVNSDRFLIHQDYNARMLYNDLAMIFFENPVPLSKYIQPIRLPPKSKIGKSFVGEIATVSGWGRTSDQSGATSPVLRYTHNEVKSNEECESIFGEFVVDGTLCSITRDTSSGICNGDSGGPLTLEDEGEVFLCGIVSYGALAGCQLNYPTGFARVTYFYDWIESSKKLHDDD